MNNNSNAALSGVHSDDRPYKPKPRTVERKIGKTTFIVSSRFNEGKEQDIASTLARLIEHDGSAQATEKTGS